MAKLINIGDLIKNTWKIYQEKFVLVIGLLFAPFLVLAIGQILMASRPGLVSLLGSLVSLVAGIGVLWGGAGLIFVLKDRARTFSLKEVCRLAWSKKLLSLIWVAILTSIIVGGGFMLFVIPGVILAVWLFFAQILVITEGEKGMKAIVKSREYVRNYFWPVLGRYLVMFVIVVIVYAVLMALATFLASLFGGHFSFTARVITSLLGVVINTLVTPLTIIYMYLVYESLKGAKGVVTIDPAKKQALWYLAIGIIGWVFTLVVGAVVLSMLATLLAGLFLGNAIGQLPTTLPDMSSSAVPNVTLPANLSAEQKQQIQTQMEALKKLQDQLKIQVPAAD